MPKTNLSIIVPLYNEKESLKELTQRIVKYTKNYNYEIIFIDDGSTDGSFEEIVKLKKINRNIKIIKFKKNFGKSYALDAGFKQAQGNYIITMDADLQDDPVEIPNLVKAIMTSNLDIISGWKFKRHDPLSKTIPSRFFNFIVRIFTGVKLHDMNCGLKIYKKEAIQNLNLYGTMYRFIPVILNLQGYRSAEIKVKHNPRKYGYSKFGSTRFLVGFLDFFTILFLLKFMQKPMHFFGTIGLFFMILGTILISYIVYLKIVFGTILAKLPLLNGGVLSFIMGGQLLSIGLLGELIISKNLYQKNYIVEKKII